MHWLLIYPLIQLKSFLAALLARVFRILLRYDAFRRHIVYPRLGIRSDSSIKRTQDRPILHAEVDGGRYHFPVFANQTRINELRQSHLRENDVLIVTYPKSGTHLCGYIVKLLAEKSVKIMQDPMVLPFYELIKQSELDSVPATTQRFLKTHLPLPLIPPPLDSTQPNKIIFCLRDPKDACVSYYKFTLGLEILTGPVYETFDDWVELWLRGCVDYGDWFDFVLPYWEQRHAQNFLFVTYEEILTEPERVIRQIADFLGYQVDQEEVAVIQEKIKFSNMKKVLEQTGNKQVSSLMREGKTGASKQAFNSRQHFLFNSMFKERTAGKDFTAYKYD